MSNENVKENANPPGWARNLLRLFCPSQVLEEVEGDLMEEFTHQLKANGTRQAQLDYVVNVTSFLRPFSNRKATQHASTSSAGNMLKNYYRTAVRNISRNKTYSFINLACLTLGLVSSMLIFQYVIFENSADEFHDNHENIYRVAIKRVINEGTPEVFSQYFLETGEAFRTGIPSVENFTRVRADFFQEGPTISTVVGDERIAFKDIRSVVVDSNFLKFFTFPLVRGDRATVLHSQSSIVLTESMALRLFGSIDAIGKTIEYSMNQGPQTMEVGGVVQDVPANSHIQFDVIIPLQRFMANIPEQARPNYYNWRFGEFTTYVELRPGADVKAAEKLMTAIVYQNIGERLKEINSSIEVQLQPMSSVYFDRSTNLGLIGFGSVIVATRTGNARMVYFFTIIAIVTLAIALMSYVNLSTVRSLERAKEVGVRKVVGAHKRSLRFQFFMESTLMNVAAAVCAVLLVILLVPLFNSFVQTNFTLSSWFNPAFLMIFGAVFVAGVLLSGLYPAFVLSSFMPIVALKGKTGSFLTSRTRLRKFLVILQYAPAIALLVCTVVVYTQLDFMRTMDVGLDMKKLITIRSPRFLPEGMVSREAESAFKNEVSSLSVVAGASYAGNQAGRGLNFLVPFDMDSTGQGGLQFMKASGVDHDFTKVYGLKILAGEGFTLGMSPTYGNPQDFIRKVLINETAARTLGFTQNENAVGRLLASTDGTRYYVQAVLEDFNWSSAHKSTDPVMLWYTPANRFMTISIAPEANVEDAISRIGTIFNRLFPTDVFHYEFAEDVYNKQYGEDEKFAKLFGIFSGMAIFIASLGLFGLSTFAAARRSKEIGIRKVMGANTRQIVQLLSKEFLFLVLIALLVASPVAWFVMVTWLQNFAFHIDLTALPFIVVGAGALLIALVTVGLRSVGVATANPVSALRDE